MSTSDRWESLQARFAAGDALDAEEERERLAGSASDPLAKDELALFAELRARGEGVEEVPRGLVDRVLAAVGSRPHLHLLAPGERPLRSRPRFRRVGLALSAALVVAAAAGAWLWVRPKAPPAAPVAASSTPVSPRLARSELVFASGEVNTPNGAVVGGRPLSPGDRVSTGEGRACIGIDPGIDVCIGAQSAIVVGSLESHDLRVRVEKGTALAALSRRENGHSFALAAGDVMVTAHGTVFAVDRAGGGALDVVVMEGAVSVQRGAAPAALVAAHSRLELPEGSLSATPEAIGRGDEARFWALLAPRELWAKPELGVLEVTAGEPGLEVSVDREERLRLPLRAFVPTGRRSLVFRSASGDEIAATVDIVAGETSVVDPAELAEKRGALAGAVPTPSAAELLASARRELAAGNARAALATYERLRAAYPASSEAHTVLVTLGKLELDLGRPERSLARFESYLKTPGPLAPEALAGSVRALRALGRTADERRALEAYVARYPDGFEAPFFRQRLEVLRGK